MADSQTSIDTKSLAIGVLTITACILFAAFLLTTTLSTPAAYGVGMNDRGGDYLMLTQQISGSTEGIVVVDAASKRLIVYAFDYSRKQLLPVSGFEFDRLQRPSANDGQRAEERP